MGLGTRALLEPKYLLVFRHAFIGQTYPPPARLGFSLVELSIVLVIVGLLVGGVLTGKSLIRAAQLRSVVTEQQNYVTAVRAFREKYFAMPGDMTNATQFWGRVAANPACRSTASTDKKTCDGDGNGFIEWISASRELFRLWQHLANAGLISGKFNGTGQRPAMKIASTAAWGIEDLPSGPNIQGISNMFDGDYKTVIYTDNPTSASLMSTSELWGIDTKLDDGKPGKGKIVIMTYGADLTDCTTATSSTDYGADYLLTSDNRTCGLWFRNQF